MKEDFTVRKKDDAKDNRRGETEINED